MYSSEHCLSSVSPWYIDHLNYLEYCSVVWHNCRATLTKRVERVQNYLPIILNKLPRSSTEEKHSQLSLPPFSGRRDISMILQVCRCQSRRAPNYPCNKFVTRDSILTTYPFTCRVKDLHLKAPRTNYIGLHLSTLEPSYTMTCRMK